MTTSPIEPSAAACAALPSILPSTRRRATGVAIAAGALTAGLMLAGCSDPTDDGSERTAASPAPSTDAPAPIDATGGGGGGAAATSTPDLPPPSGEGTGMEEHPRVASFAGLRGPKPPTWQWQSQRPMRAGTWTIPGRSGGDFAELTAFVGIGGGIEANLTRWVGQFRSPELRQVEPERWEVAVPGLDTTATMVQLIGEFAGMSGTFRPGQAMLGALLDSSIGPIQLKMTGPEDVVLAAREDFEALVAGLAPRDAYPLPTDGAERGGETSSGDTPPTDAGADAGTDGQLDAMTGWPMAWFTTTGEPPARRERHLAIQGSDAPTVAIDGVIGGPADLASLRGSVVVVDFWGTWCAPCMKAIPKMIALQERHRDDGVVFLGIHSTLDGPRPMDAAAAELGINYPIGRDVDRTSEIAWGVRQWPFYAIVGRDGTVLAAGLRSDFVGDAIARVLGEERDESA